jgi:hypothetical protein
MSKWEEEIQELIKNEDFEGFKSAMPSTFPAEAVLRLWELSINEKV